MQYIVKTANKRTSPGPSKSDLSPASAENAFTSEPRAAVKTTTTQTSTVARHSTDSSAIFKAKQIISEESGIAVDALADDTCFNDAGIDSLLSLVISSRIRDELGIEVESSVFLQVTTMGSFETYLKGLVGHAEESTTVTETVKEEVAPFNAGTIRIDTAANETTWNNVLEIIAEESRINITDLTNNTNFSDIGVDSLLSLVICSRMRDELGLDIPDKSLFLEFDSVKSLRNHIVGHSQPIETEMKSFESTSPTPSTSSSHSSIKDFAGTPDTEVLELAVDSIPSSKARISSPVRPAWSITLQGSSKRAKERLFLFPDGCGAATSYVGLPKLSQSIAVIGFNSPYMR